MITQNENDCALTIDPSIDQLCLLETIPGRQFRSRLENQDQEAAVIYFRNVVEDAAQPRINPPELRSLIGTDYKPKYHGLLSYIPPEQLTFEDISKPLGSGLNGAVYGALWNWPQALLCTMQHAEPQLRVVVKKAQRGKDDILNVISEAGSIPIDNNSTPSQMWFFDNQLDATFTALVGSHTCCVTFLGLTICHVDEDGYFVDKSTSGKAERQLMLVFERASEGNLEEFMEKQLGSFEENQRWPMIIDFLTSIANGLYVIHKHGVAHRYVRNDCQRK